MSQHRNVPGLARGPQIFSKDSLGPVPSPMSPPASRPILGSAQQPAPGQEIAEAAQELAMEIYARLAIDHIRCRPSDPVDVSYLKMQAKHAQAAAMAYFQSMGVHFEDSNNG